MRLIRWRFRASVVACVLLLPVVAWAQTTQPATPRDWPAMTQGLAAALVGNELPALQAMLEPAPVIRTFSSDAQQAARLLGMTSGSRVVAVHAYPAIPQSLASDLAEDFRAAGDAIPELTRQQMIPSDETAARRANATAASWIASVLRQDESASTPIAVIVLWPAERKSRLEGPARRAIFVVARGQRRGDHFIFHEIVFGDPLEPPR